MKINMNLKSGSEFYFARKIIANLFLGLLVIAVGVGYLGNLIDFLPWSNFTLLFPGWYGVVFFIVPALYFMIRKNFSWFMSVMALIGVTVFITENEIFPFKKVIIVFAGVLAIIIGLKIIFSPLIKRRKLKKIQNKMSDSKESFSYSDGDSVSENESETHKVSFSENTINYDGQEFKSGTFACSFGQMTVDLTNALIDGCAVIDAKCNFGELDIKLPPDAVAEVVSSVVFGEIENSRKKSGDFSGITVYINANCAFGKIEIK